MSTKINARSPYYLKIEPVVETIGNFTCDRAGLSNFSVSSGGRITQPTLAEGTILSASASSFPANATGSPISRTVTYTIRIPQIYDNYSSGTINCDATFDQPSQTAQEDPAQNATCPSKDADISDITHTALTDTTTVDLTTKFSAGTGDSISKYEVYRVAGSALVTGTISGSTLTHTTPANCTTATFQVAAFNSDNSCNVLTAEYDVTAPCPKALHCTLDDASNVGLDLTGGGVDPDGTIHNPLTTINNIQPIRYERPLNTTVTSIPENTTGSDVTIDDLYFVYEVPAGFSNAGSELKCQSDADFTQRSTTQPARDLVCSDVAAVTGISITSSGAINTVGAKFYIAGDDNTYLFSDYAGWVRNADGGTTFPVVSTQTARTVYYNFKVPTSTWSNHNSYISVDCSTTIYQDAADICGTFTAYLSNQAFTSVDDICGDLGAFTIDVAHQFNVTSYNQIATGKKVCLNGTTKFGDNKYYVVNQQSLDSTADNYSTWFVIKIDRDGNITEELYHECEADI